jgi:hypothetical protein
LGETEPVKCPFCGAPYRDVVPANVVQVKCKYCGGVFHVPAAFGAEVARCVNHPEKVAVGLCNDCGQNFCGTCLHAYQLTTRTDSTTLYLCPDCLKARYGHNLRTYSYLGAFFILVGLPFTFVTPIVGVVFLVPGAFSFAYGLLNRPEEVQESNVDELKAQQEEKKAEFLETDGVDYDAMYDKLVARYENHYGPGLGIQLLEDEINAYVRHGQSFPEAVIAVYRRHENTNKP